MASSEPQQIELLLRCGSFTCRAGLAVVAVPLPAEAGVIYTGFRTPEGCPIEACPKCGHPFPRVRWSRVPMLALANRLEIDRAREENAPLPEEIAARAAEIRSTWTDPEVMAGRNKAFAMERRMERERREKMTG